MSLKRIQLWVPLILFVLLAIPNTSQADILAICNVPSANYGSVGAATNDNTCDIIKVAAGTFSENITINRNLTLEGVGSSSTILDGGDNGTVVRIREGLSVAIRNIRIANGNANRGGGIYIEADAEVSTQFIVFDSNSATSEGGQVYAEGGVTLFGATLQNGTAPNGAGIFANNGAVFLDEFYLDNNDASTNGGGIFANGNVRLEDGTFKDNSAGENGGGIYARGEVTLLRVIATSNDATDDGGAIFTENAATRITDSTMSNNRAANGGAIYGFEGSVDVASSFVNYNTATTNGGGIFVSGINPTLREIAVTYNFSELIGNQALVGGGMEMNGGSRVFINGTTIKDNKARDGAGINIAGNMPRLTVNGSQFDNNDAYQAGGGAGGGVRITGNPVVVMSNTVFKNNDAFTDGGGIAVDNASVQLSLFSTKFFDNVANRGGGLFAKGNNLVLDKTVYAGNHANDDGGGVFLETTGNTILNSTFSRNSTNADGRGSAIYSAGFRIDFATFAYNSGSPAVWKAADATANTVLNNAILFNPDTSNCGGEVDEIIGTSTTDSDGTCTLPGSRSNQMVDPLLDPVLGEDGTHALLPGSPAIDTASNCTAVDQRGIVRTAPCDRGAYEVSSTSAPTAINVATSSATGTNSIMLWLIIFANATLIIASRVMRPGQKRFKVLL